jgi:hypothetical protein
MLNEFGFVNQDRPAFIGRERLSDERKAKARAPKGNA